jgi:hypothetical protein
MKKEAYGCRVVATLRLVSWLKRVLCRARGDKKNEKKRRKEKKKISTTRDGGRSDQKSVPFHTQSRRTPYTG